MRAKLGSSLLLGLALLVVQTKESRADFAQCSTPLAACTATSSGCCYKAFPPSGGYNPLIITSDRCHQPVGTGTLAPPGSGPPRLEWAISSISRSTTTVTVTTTAGTHTIPDDGFVRISGTGVSELNGTYQVETGTGCTPNCASNQFQYQTTGSGSVSATTGFALSHNRGHGWCADSPGTDATRIGGNASDTGMMKQYGLIYRLMQRGIPVYWLVNPTKVAPALTGSQSAAAQTFLATDVDFWVLTSDLTDPPTSGASLTGCTTGCTQPIQRLTQTTLVPKTDSYRYKEFPVRGGAFLIAPENRAAFNAFWLRTGAYASLASETKYDWANSGIDLYELESTAKIVYQDFNNGDGTSAAKFTTITGAPVAVKIDYEPPRIACIGCDNAVAQNWLATAGLRDPATPESCATGEFVPSDATYCVIDDFEVSQGILVAGGFSWAWVLDYNDNSPCGNSAEKAMFDKLRDFMTSVPAVRNAGHSVFLDSSLKVAEGCPNKQLLGTQQTADGFDLSVSGGTEPFILRYPNNLFMQYGDIPTGFASGTMGDGWKYYKSGSPTTGYQTAFQASGSSLRRLASVDRSAAGNTLCVQHQSSTACDVFTPGASTGDIQDMAAYARFQDQLNNGLVYYLPGNQLDNNGNISELRMLLNSLLAIPDESYNTTPTTIEVSRSSPVIATIDAEELVFTATYERPDPIPSIPKATTSASLVRFTFPYLKGHVRAIPIANFTTTRTDISAMTDLYDAADGIPTANAAGCGTSAFTGTCRTVFTTLKTGRLPTRVDFTTGNLGAQAAVGQPTLGELLASNLTTSERQTLVSRVLAGVSDGAGGWVSKLGGVDRSTPAVIGPSPLAGSAGRPTMIYVGATDGMLHAICASTGNGCTAGKEMWAYIPRSVLPDLRQSTARVDGSPHVIDAFGDFDNDGVSSFATILLFATGTGRMVNDHVVPAVYAIDITSPLAPKVIWEYAVLDVGTRGTYDMGVGINLSAGVVSIGGVNKTVAFIQSNNGGTGGAASVVTAINVETGAEIWQQGDLYPTSGGNSARNTSHEAAPASGVPGGAVGIDKTGNGKVSDIVYGTLYGDVFVRSADTGTNQNGSGPLLRISADYKPIGVPAAIYREGTTTYAAFGTGGYYDTQSTLWRGENEAVRPLQMAFAVNIGHTGSTITEADATNVPVKFDLASGDSVFSQLIVIGGQLFVNTDSTNINDFAFGTSASATGKVYNYDFAGTSPGLGTTMVIGAGAGSIFNSGTKLISASGKHGERLSQDAISNTGQKVDPTSQSKTAMTRKLWLRSE